MGLMGANTRLVIFFEEVHCMCDGRCSSARINSRRSRGRGGCRGKTGRQNLKCFDFGPLLFGPVKADGAAAQRRRNDLVHFALEIDSSSGRFCPPMAVKERKTIPPPIAAKHESLALDHHLTVPTCFFCFGLPILFVSITRRTATRSTPHIGFLFLLESGSERLATRLYTPSIHRRRSSGWSTSLRTQELATQHLQ